jgi:hypothetical protein
MVFRCEADGYESIVFGAFDGVTSWTNNAFIDLGPLHQEIVDAHEERHLRLQKGTPWGILLMLLALIDPADPELAQLVDACRRTHESYATYLSTAHVADGISTLQDNAVYLDYWRTGAALADVFDSAAPVLPALEYLFHLAMAPAALSEATLAANHETLLTHAPDVRLAEITQLLVNESPLTEKIAAAVSTNTDVAVVQDQLAALLTSHGIPTLTTSEQLTYATRLMDEFNAHSNTHRASIEERSRATSLTDQLDHQQHAILSVQRRPVALRVGPPAPNTGKHPLTDYVMDDKHLGPHVWGVVLSAGVIDRQFQPTESLADERYWGFLAVDRRGKEHFARLWPIPDPPLRVTAMLAEQGIQTVLMTTMSTLTDTYARTPFSATTPVFVLVDLPLLPFLRGLQAENTNVRWVHAGAIGSPPLQLIVLKLDGPDPLHFVIIRSTHTVRSTVEWLRRAETFSHDRTLSESITPYLNALTHHLAGTFWAFETTRSIAAAPQERSHPTAAEPVDL